MGKKSKIGKQRKDKYYKLAKEAGYRSRAAFKLIQLNKRFEFLENSRALVDLCAAPGGWMQVASQHMPVSSLCIGVDLVPIKAVRNCIGLQGDITTEQTRQAIRKELNNWTADTVLHDGAPNVGTNWIHDAFQQNCLVLSSLKLTTQILKKNGTFVTKVFRSNDYSCLIAVFEKLFKRVHVWKPAASRLESAEIFVVCEKYLKPPKVPAELLDPKKVFANPDGSEPTKVNGQTMLLSKRKDRKAKAEGYDDGVIVLYKPINATDFIQSFEYMDFLATANKIVLDQDKWKEHEATTEEVKACMEDLKVCGPRELRLLLRWRKTMRKVLEDELKALDEELGEEKLAEEELTPEDLEDQALAEIDEMISKAKEDEKASLKKKRRMMLKAKAKVLKRRQLKMIIDGDVGDIHEDLELFSLKKIRRARELAQLTQEGLLAPDVTADDDDEEEGLGDGEWETRDGVEVVEEDEAEIEEASDDESDNELLVTENSRLNKQELHESRAHKWFQREDVAGLISDDDSDAEMNVIEKHMKREAAKGDAKYTNTVSFDDESKETKKRSSRKRKSDDLDKKDEESDDDDEEEDEQDSDADQKDSEPAGSRFAAEMAWEDEEVEEGDDRATKREATKTILGENLKPKAKKKRLTPEELALGEQMIYSSKAARNLEEWGWNRYANNDEGLPDWFVEDERRHYRKDLPVTKEQVKRYREQMRELNARPCKKVAEAKARKQRRVRQKMDRARKKAEGVVENDNLEHAEKVRELKKIYGQASKKEEKKVEYVRVTRGKKGKMSRPGGKYKLVDSRMKKDLRAAKAKEKTKGRGGRGKKPASTGGSKKGKGGRGGARR